MLRRDARDGEQAATAAAVPGRMPSGDRYGTVLDEDELAPIVEGYGFPRHVRSGRDRAGSTTATSAGAVKLFLARCARSGLGRRECAGRLGPFVFRLRHTRLDGDPVVGGPGQRAVRGPRPADERGGLVPLCEAVFRALFHRPVRSDPWGGIF